MISKSKAIKIPSLDADTILGLLRFCGKENRNATNLTGLVRNSLLVIAKQNKEPEQSVELETYYKTITQVMIGTRTNQPEQGE